jgi:PAS domain S-box-containing protein
MVDRLASETVLEAATEALSETVVVATADGEVTDVVSGGPSGTALGPPSADLVGATATDLVPPSEVDAVREAIRKAADTDDCQQLTHEVDAPAGTWIVESRFTSLDGETSEAGGESVLWCVEAVVGGGGRLGLTERILEVSPVGLVVVERSGEISIANRRAEEILGLGRDEITSRTYTQPEWRITDDDGSPIPEEEHPVTRVFETGEPVFGFEHWIERDDGTRRWLSSHSAPITDRDGEVRRVVVGLDDATELKAREERMRWLIETEELADVGGWELDPETGEMETTAGMSSIHGNDAHGLTFEEMLEYYPPDDRERLHDAVEACRETGEPFDLELRRTTTEGAERWVRVTGDRIERGAETPLRGVVRDVTASKQREQRLTVINRILRHNLRNEVNVIAGNAELIRTELERLEEPEEVDETELATAVREVSRATEGVETDLHELRTLVENVSQFSVDEALARTDRVERASGRLSSIADRACEFEEALRCDGEDGSVDVRAVLEELQAEYAEEFPDATIRVEPGTDGAVPTVAGNRRALRLLLEVPLENALEHNDRGAPEVSCRLERTDDDRLRLRIVDDGPGIPDVERSVIDEGEETELFHGSGLGLWTMNWLATRLGAGVTIGENDPRGTVVELTFPGG